MTYNHRESLCILQISDEAGDDVSFETLAEVLMEKPSNTIYCERRRKLVGIISMGDIYRSRKNDRKWVRINKEFSYVNRFEYMKAREIFLEEEHINALPIIDDNNVLLGDFTRWDDLLSGYLIGLVVENRHFDTVCKSYKKIAFVLPSKGSKKKTALVEKWRCIFLNLGIELNVIQKNEIPEAFNDYDIVLFSDEDEIRGLGTLYSNIIGKTFRWECAKTLRSFEKTVVNTIIEIERGIVGQSIGESVLKDIANSGVYLLTLQVLQNDSSYWAIFNKEIEKKRQTLQVNSQLNLTRECWKDFFGDLYTCEYASEIVNVRHDQIKDGLLQKLKDVESKYYNVKDGERFTVDQPNEYDSTIYFFGPCLMIGVYSEDKHTIESMLQRFLNKNGYKVKVVNCGCWSDELLLLYRMLETDFKKGDVAVVYYNNKNYSGLPNLNLAEIMEKKRVPYQWFLDCAIHANYKGNMLFAQAIYEALPKKLIRKKSGNNAKNGKIPMESFVSYYTETYFAGRNIHKKTGAIVMNCNPFTNGHRYLIEEASKSVEELIIFVVEENRSLFSFDERFAMVVEGTKDIENVRVVPSGDLILSNQTFPEYFVKIEDENVSQNAEIDITLFSKGIAPRLNIRTRFVGEEMTDAVTAEYNRAMKRILPQNDIGFVEIPRRRIGSEVISATKVRNLLRENDSKQLRQLVPQSTINIMNIC